MIILSLQGVAYRVIHGAMHPTPVLPVLVRGFVVMPKLCWDTEPRAGTGIRASMSLVNLRLRKKSSLTVSSMRKPGRMRSGHLTWWTSPATRTSSSMRFQMTSRHVSRSAGMTTTFTLAQFYMKAISPPAMSATTTTPRTRLTT